MILNDKQSHQKRALKN